MSEKVRIHSREKVKEEEPEFRELKAEGLQSMMPPEFNLQSSSQSNPIQKKAIDEDEEAGGDKGWGVMDYIHTGLDFAGFFPGLGAIPDLINAGIYAMEGNWEEAAWSAGAAIPIAGDIAKGGKMAHHGIKVLDKANDTRKALDKVGDGKKVVSQSNEVVKSGRKNKLGDAAKKKPYTNSRPSYRKGQVEDVWKNAKQKNGKVYDPNTGEEIIWDQTKKRNGQWDMGHLPEQEYNKVHKRYMSGEVDRETFLREFHDPKKYRPELPSSNRSRKFEAK